MSIHAIVSWILGFVLAVPLVADGLAKLLDERSMVRLRQHLVVDRRLFRLLGVGQILAGCGLVIGLVLFERSPAIGVIAGLAVVALMGLIVHCHRRVNDGLGQYTSTAVIAVLGVGFVIALLTRAVAA